MKYKIIFILTLLTIFIELNPSVFAQYHLMKSIYLFQVNTEYNMVDTIISEINKSHKLQKRIEKKEFLKNSLSYLQTYNHYRENFDSSYDFKYLKNIDYLILDTTNLLNVKYYFEQLNKKRLFRKLNKIGITLNKVKELQKDLRRLLPAPPDPPYVLIINNLLKEKLDPEVIAEPLINKAKRKKLPCYFKLTVDTIGTSVKIKFIFGDTITGGEIVADKLDTLKCDPKIKHPDSLATFPPNRYLTPSSKLAIDFIAECINDIIKDTILNPNTLKSENKYYTDDITGIIIGGADLPEPSGRFYSNDFGEISNISIYNLNTNKDETMSIDSSEVLTNKKLAFLRAYTALYYIKSIRKSNGANIGSEHFVIKTFVSNRYRNTPDRFVKVELYINGALNYLFKMQKKWEEDNMDPK